MDKETETRVDLTPSETIKFTNKLFTYKPPEPSGWKCELFGMKNGLVYYPMKGQVPNWFWRKMQYLILGNKWSKTTTK